MAGLLEDSGAARLPKPPALLRPADFQGSGVCAPSTGGLLAGLLAQPAGIAAAGQTVGGACSNRRPRAAQPMSSVVWKAAVRAPASISQTMA